MFDLQRNNYYTSNQTIGVNYIILNTQFASFKILYNFYFIIFFNSFQYDMHIKLAFSISCQINGRKEYHSIRSEKVFLLYTSMCTCTCLNLYVPHLYSYPYLITSYPFLLCPSLIDSFR